MCNIALVSDTSCDLDPKLIQKYDITLVPYYVSFDKEEYYKEIKELSIKDFYTKMRQDKIFPKTSLPSINDYMEIFKPLVEEKFPLSEASMVLEKILSRGAKGKIILKP